MAKRIHHGILIPICTILILNACGTEPKTPFLKQMLKKNKEISIDLNEDGLLEKGIVENHQAKIYSNNQLIFKSTPEWHVHEIIAGDFNNDQKNDFGITLWKHGNYGPDTPFWVEENDDSYKMHFFLYTWKYGKIAPLWHSSNLPRINFRSEFIKNDKQNLLVVLESNYDFQEKQKISLGIWRWSVWGFELVRRIPIF